MDKYTASMYGISVYLSNSMVAGHKQRRTHRRWRINKKWLKKYGSISIPSKNILVSNIEGRKMIVVHPVTWREVERQLAMSGSDTQIMKGSEHNV